MKTVTIIDGFEDVCKVIKDFFSIKMENGGVTNAVPYPMQNIPTEWNINLMASLRKHWDLVHLLEGIPLILVTNQSQRFLWRLSKTEQPLVSSNLSPEMSEFLLATGAYFVDQKSLGKDDDLYYLEKKGYILNSSCRGSVIGFIEKQAAYLGELHLKEIHSKRSCQKLNMELLTYISEADRISKLFYHLPLFPVLEVTGFVSANQANIVYKENVPKEWNNDMFPLVDGKAIPNAVIQKFGLEEWSRLRISKEMVCEHLAKISNQASFFDRVLEENMSLEFVNIFKPCLHIQTENGSRQKPAALFEKTPLSTKVFFGQMNCFPSTSYGHLMPIVKKFGLKKQSEITNEDLRTSIGEIVQNFVSWKESDLLAKVDAVLEVAVINSVSLQVISDQKWIPVQVEKPTLYPKNLNWFEGSRLSSPSEIFTTEYQSFVGSVASVVNIEINQNFSSCFKNRLRTPAVAEMLSHLENIQRCYDDEEKGRFKEMTIDIYRQLNKTPNLMLQHFHMLTHIWQGNMFIPIQQLTLVKTTHNLSPYYYEIPADVADHLRIALTQSIGSVTEYDLYVSVLKAMASKNEQERTEIDCMADLNLSINLVKFLSENQLEMCLKDRGNIYVPVESSQGHSLKLFPVTECYCIEKSRSGKYSETYSTNKIIHHMLGKEVASMLKVPSLISKVLGGKRSKFFKACGQTEPLTLRLNRLLEEYRDGLAIIKELIQNADDAGASTVKLLYDKRMNNDKRELLVDEGMKEWQGPALWVYNDQTFTESDFENITKLNAGTKEFDTKKIGKFGLGFNSVYHLTDVPSFLSGDNLVIFDPHTDFLGEALESKDVPGIRIPLSDNMNEFISFKHQFEIFNGIFDARFDFQSGFPFSYFDGTLFRLPLRKQEMAEKSKIKAVEYSDSEMRELFCKLKESLEDIILFTEKVKCLEVWEMSNITSSMTCLFKVEKENIQPIHSCTSSIVEKANNQLKAVQQAGGRLDVLTEENVTTSLEMNVWHGDDLVSSRHWLTCSDVGSQESFQYAIKKKGHLPCGGVAIPFLKEGDKTTVVDHSGFLFCFLPLPIHSFLPIHLNAAFDVSKNRQSLTELSTDDKSYRKDENWNKLLSKDLGKSYYNLFNKLPDMFPYLSIEDWMTKIMPASSNLSQNLYSQILVKDFLQRFFSKSSDVRVVPTPKGWLPWNRIRCLHQSFNEKIVRTSIDFMNWFYKDTYECIVFPEAFCKLANDLGYEENLNEVTVTQETLFTKFLENIGSRDLDLEIRNKLLDHILELGPGGKLKKLLEATKCIPTKPSDTLKLPSQLVKEESKAAKVYLTEDEVFPRINESRLEYLLSLGMQKNHLPWEMLIERARSIEILYQRDGYKTAEKRLSELLELTKGSREEPTRSILNQLIDIPFLAVLLQPSNLSFLPWFHQGQEQFSKPSAMFSNDFEKVVSCSSLISKFGLPKKISRIIDKRPPNEMVHRQMEHLVKCYCENGNILTPAMLDVLYELYDNLDVYSVHSLRDLQCIHTAGNKLAKPYQVFIQIPHEVPDWLFQINPQLDRYRTLMVNFGVQQYFQDSLYIEVFKSIHDSQTYLSSELLDQIISKVIPYLCEKGYRFVPEELYLPDSDGTMCPSEELCYKDQDWLPEDEYVKFLHENIPRKLVKKLHVKSLREDLFIRHPDADEFWCDFGQKEKLTNRIKNLLRGYSDPQDIFKEMFQNADDAGATRIEFILDKRKHSDKMVFSNRWKPLQGPAFLVCNNGKFTQKDLKGIQNLGVGSKREDPLSTGKYGVGFNAVYSITDCPALLTDVEGFGDVLCIFDPNLNYAEGASERKPGRMMKDARRLLHKYPDVLSSFLINEVDTKGQTLFRFPLRDDEMRMRSNISELSTSPIIMEHLMKKIKDKAYNILLFLRNICSVEFTVIEFNGKIQRETFVTRTSETASIECKSFKQYEKDFPAKLSDISTLQSSGRMLIRQLCMQHYEDSKPVNVCHWEVIEQCGFSDVVLPDAIQYQARTGRLQLVPKGGIAKLVTQSKCAHCSDLKVPKIPKKVKDSNGVFCTLPLPVKTGFPAIVNGNFILEYETRRNLMNNSSMYLEKSWNEVILEHCVLPCFIRFLERRVEELAMQNGDPVASLRIVQDYYKIFPCISDGSDSYWRELSEKFYANVFEKNLRVLFVNRNGNLIPCAPQEDFLLYNIDEEKESSVNTIYSSNTSSYTRNNFAATNFSSNTSSLSSPPKLLSLIKQLFIHADSVPSTVEKNFKEVNLPLVVMTPTLIRDRLSMVAEQVLPNGPQSQVKDTLFKTSENVITVLNYCLQDCVEKDRENEIEKEITLDGLPLCLLPNGTLELFSPTNKKFRTGYSDLFPEEPLLFVHRHVFESIRDKPLLDGECFKYFGLDSFTMLLEQNLEKSDKLQNKDPPIPFESSDAKLVSWIRRVWNFLCSLKQKFDQQESNFHLSPIGKWSLALVQQNEVKYLLPIAKRTHALYFKEENLPIKNMLVKIGIFQPVEKFYPNEQESWIFGKLSDPNDVIDAIDYAKTLNKDYTLTSEEASQILKHLATYYNRITNPSKLKSLVLFERFDEKLTAINNTQKRVIMMPDYVPFNGLHIVEEQNSCIFLKHNKVFQILYQQLNIGCVEWYDFYSCCLLRCVDSLSNEDMKPHLSYLKRMVNEEKDSRLISVLRGCKLFPNRLGDKALCKDMYDPSNSIFKEMLPDDFFPDAEFCDYQWLGFLKELGLVSEMTTDLFVMFCKQLAECKDLQKVGKVSGLLCGELQSDEKFRDNVYFLQRIANVKFLIPSRISDNLEKIHPSENSTVDRISYHNSCMNTLDKLVWTSKHVLPNYSTTYMNENTKSRLGVITNNSLDHASVISNFENILVNTPENFRQITTTYKEIKNELVGPYFDVMEKLYETQFIRDVEFKQMPCVLVNDGKPGLDIPRRSVQSQEEYTIHPYLNLIPLQLGKHFSTLGEIGCSKDVKPCHLVDVLQEVQTISKGGPIGPNEQIDAKKAFCFLSQKIRANKTESVENELYLPSVSFVEPNITRMKKSTECIYVDDARLEKRLQKFSSPLLMFSYGKELDNDETANTNLVNELTPLERRPRLLSQSIIEGLDETSDKQITVPVDSSHISRIIKRRIKNPVFIDCVERLFAHEDLECGSVAHSLSNVQVFVKRNIKTVLNYQDKVIPESDAVKKLFMRLNDGQLEIYFSADALADRQLESTVAGCLLIALGNRLKSPESLFALPLLLTEDIGSLSDMLDEKGISRGSGESAFKNLGAQPIPGDPVPLELHSLLRQDFSSFEKGEFVAVRQEDDEHYHYAIFHRMDYNPDLAARLYGVQLNEDEECITEIAAYSVFKFERSFIKSENANALLDFAMDFKEKSLEGICKEIKRIFDGIKNMNKATRKLIIRRLYLAWHPDKHPEETKDLATEVFKYIQQLIKQSEDGKNDDFTYKWDTWARNWAHQYREYTTSYRKSSWGHHHYTPPTFRSLNPQPAEAKRWWRQATFDVDAAREIKINHEWACYIAHQVRSLFSIVV